MDEEVAALVEHLSARYALGAPLRRELTGGWHARRRADGLEVVIDLPHPHIDWWVAKREQFRQAHELQASLDHPTILRIIERGEVGALPFRVTARPRGASLATVSDAGPLPLARALEAFAAIAAGLSHAHERGVAKVEFSAEDVWIGPDDGAVVDEVPAAAGLPYPGSRLDAPGARMASPLTTDHALAWGLEKAPTPERRRAADSYGLAGLLYWAVTRASHMRDTDVRTLMRNPPRWDHVPLRERLPDAPRSLEALLARALHPDASSRPSMREMREQLARLAR